MNRNDKIVNMPAEQVKPNYPELFTDDELVNFGEVVSTTERGQVFVLKDDKMYLFQPVARRYRRDEEYYYNRVEFE